MSRLVKKGAQMRKKTCNYAEALKIILAVIERNGPMTSKEISKKLPKKDGENAVREGLFHKVLKMESTSDIGQIIKTEMPGRIYYHTVRQGTLLIERIVRDMRDGVIKIQARADVLISHSEKINGILEGMLNQLPSVTLDPEYPAGGLHLRGQTTVKRRSGFNSRCDLKGPADLPIENNVLFAHMFEHNEIGQPLLDEYHRLIEALIGFEKMKGNLYCKLDRIIRERIALVNGKLLVSESFVDSIYDMLVTKGYSYEEMATWKLARDGPYVKINRGDDALTEGWLFTNDVSILNEKLEKDVNLAYLNLVEEINNGPYRSDISTIKAEYERVTDVRAHFVQRVEHLRLREIYSMCSLVTVLP